MCVYYTCVHAYNGMLALKKNESLYNKDELWEYQLNDISVSQKDKCWMIPLQVSKVVD